MYSCYYTVKSPPPPPFTTFFAAVVWQALMKHVFMCKSLEPPLIWFHPFHHLNLTKQIIWGFFSWSGLGLAELCAPKMMSAGNLNILNMLSRESFLSWRHKHIPTLFSHVNNWDFEKKVRTIWSRLVLQTRDILLEIRFQVLNCKGKGVWGNICLQRTGSKT